VSSLKVTVPIKVDSLDSDVIFETKLAIELTKNFQISIQNPIEILKFECKKPQSNCDKIQNDLINTFASKIMPFEGGDYWD
jgi:hypothetical protein